MYIIHTVCILISLPRWLEKFRHLRSPRISDNYSACCTWFWCSLWPCPAGITGSVLRPGGAPGAVPGAVPLRTRGSARTGAPGAGTGTAGGRGRAAGTREGLARGTESVKGTTAAPVKVLKVPVRWILMFSHSSWLLCWCLWWISQCLRLFTY